MATSKRGKNRPPAVKSRDSGGVPESLFGGERSDIIPGDLIMQLDAAAASAVTQSIASGPSRGMAMVGPAGFGVTDIDRVLNRLGCRGIRRLHGPAPVMAASAGTEIQLTEMANTFRVGLPPEQDVEKAAQALQALDSVVYAEPNRWRETSVVPNDPNFAAQWGLTRIRAPEAWDRTTGSPQIVVGVLDTGIDLDHPELAGLLVAGTDMVDLGPNPTPPAGFRFEGDWQGRDSDPQDEVGHGTHVAGTIACATNNGSLVAGVTWNCRLMPVKVLTRIVNIGNPADVRGIGSSADVAAGIRWAADHGARVINLSLSSSQATNVERDAVAYAVSRGVVVVAAMGNAGPNAGPAFPAAYPDVIAVGAIDSSDRRAGFSQVGAHIDVAAPGVGILSTVWNNATATFQGTSMASPHVAGVAALILSCNAALTAAQVGDIIRQTAQPLRDAPGDPVPNNPYGFGCVDAKAAIDRACPQMPVTRTVQCTPSRLVRCPPTHPVRCPPTNPVSCPQTQIVRCQTQVVRCQTLEIRCGNAPSRLIRCPTLSSNCPIPSATVRCPTLAQCGFDPGGPIGRFAEQEWDPYAGYEDWGGMEDAGDEGGGGCGNC